MKRMRMIPGFVALALVVASAVVPAVAAGDGPNGRTSDRATTRPAQDTTSALAQLAGAPLATDGKTKPAPGKKIDFTSNAVKAYRAQLAALRNDFKAWLRANAPNARVVGEYDISLNAVSVRLNGESLSTIARAPQVVRVEYQGLYYPSGDDPDLSIVKAFDAWNRAGGSATAGEGVKVAVVDTGIDITNPCFADAGYPAQKRLGDPRFTNNKVIAAKVFSNKTPSQGYTPEAVQDHGTHVAGTVACNYNTPATVSGVAIPYGLSGVAPRALLGNYNVFPGTAAEARSEDILNALEAAYEDGFDVANMSLGGSASGIQDLLTVAVDNLDRANMVVAVAAGNEGPGHYTVASPGSAARALTAGASTVPHFVGAPVTVGGATYGGAAGEFATVSADLSAPLGVVPGTTNGLSTACTTLPAGSLNGQIGLISRGVCTFSTKIRNAQDAGAVAVLVANNVAGDPVAMAQDGTANQPTVPAYMVALSTGQALVGQGGATTTIGKDLAYIRTPSVDIMAGFSSQGPTDVDFRVKPDVVAPGVNVLSSITKNGCSTPPCFAFFQGTSMAAPHLAGSAAVVKQQHPDWSAAQIRSAIVNTADQGVLKSFRTGTTPVLDVNVVGAGRLNLLSAVNARVALDPVSISFGAVPSGAGQTKSFEVTLTNVSAQRATYGLSLSGATNAQGQPASGIGYTLRPSSVTLDPGRSGVVTVTMAASKGIAAGDYQATLSVTTGGSQVAHAAVYTLVK